MATKKIKLEQKTGLKKHHKIMIGSFSTIVIIYMIVTAILLNGIIVKQTVNHNEMSQKLENFEAETQNNINQISDNLMKTNEQIDTLNAELGNIDQEFVSLNKEFSSLKASAGEDFSGIIEDAVKGVVTIRTNVGQGTGFIITNSGYVITNAHVLSGANWVNTINYKQETIEAEFIGADINNDLALLKIPSQNNYLELTNSNNVQVGEKVIAIGNPLGLQFSVSQGIVSGVHREGPSGLDAYIQTDAALNPGNSGGPLIDKDGKVIGINNFKLGGGESLGFALESNYIKETVNNIYLNAVNETLI